jgi:MinD-like ATPase involved in chromosome partitioning or flagellar assembly/GTPase SAR1 family protein
MKQRGKIITFYSYKGGTGRSMALANVAWILASQGKRVLTLDWDLEAPGLHRYFQPFLTDKDLTASEGIIDFVQRFMTAASIPQPNANNEEKKSVDDKPDARNEPDDEWYKPYTNILRYAASLDWEFKNEGTIDFIPAGRQGSSYATRINSFDWRFFYEKLGGGRLLELAKEKMRSEYDYILIDSRTGVSDTSGICTIQMPDILVVCFTLNNQGIDGAAAISQDVFEQRFNSVAAGRDKTMPSQNSSEANETIRIFPVPMRIENAEKVKLQTRTTYSREKFKLFPNAMSESEREKYWGAVPFVYVPYYAYEEILAAFGDNASDRISILDASEHLTSYITDGEITKLEPMPEEARRRVLKQFEESTWESNPEAEQNRFAETILVALTAEEQSQMQQLMLRLIRISQEDEFSGDTLLRVDNNDIESDAKRVLSIALGSGLVELDGDDFIKISHDSLLNNWKRLREWINADREFLLWRQKLQVRLGEWQRLDYDRDSLLKGTSLDEAGEWLDSRGNWLNDSETRYIKLSITRIVEEEEKLVENAEKIDSEINNNNRIYRQIVWVFSFIFWLFIGFIFVGAILDAFSNSLKIFSLPDTVFFNPTFLATLILIPIIFNLVCLLLAPKVNFCHYLIMDRRLRAYFSLGMIPLFLSIFPWLRQHILRRYVSGISKDKEFEMWKTRFIPPGEEFFPENFGKRLEKNKRLLLVGQSGVGKTSFFKYLAANYASSEDRPSFPRKVIPIYISLRNYGGNSIKDLVYSQLFAYGEITDRELAEMFLSHGGFLIFIDGVNDIGYVQDRQRLVEFIERYWTTNYICLSSQQVYPEIENILKFELKTFKQEKIIEFIRLNIDDHTKAERIIADMTDETYQLYSVPLDLEFAVTILNEGKNTLPKSRTELYGVFFDEVFSKWRMNGQDDAPDTVCQHAYKMLVFRDLAFDSAENPRFYEITNDLYEQKFLIRRGKNYIFRHDLIRAYLASEYFYPRWQILIKNLDGKQIDNNWLEMLKLSCEKIENPIEIKELIYEVMERSFRENLVKELFTWLKTNYSYKVETWEDNFYTRYGEKNFR